MDSSLRVLVVDDDPFTRVVVTATLRSLGYVVVADAESVTPALQQARALRPDVAVVDLDLGEGPTGIDLAHGLRRLLPGIGILLLSTYEEPRLLGHRQAPLPDGAVYLVKRTVSDPDVLRQGVELAQRFGDAESASPKVASTVGNRVMSDQQVEIMRLVAGGHSNAEIARRRCLTESAVEKAVARLIKQLEITTDSGQNPRVMIAQKYFQMSGAVRVRRT